MINDKSSIDINMKKLLISAIALAALVACKSEPQKTNETNSLAEFYSNIAMYHQTRVTGNKFDGNDAIGIHMTGAATQANAKYVTVDGGETAKFTPADDANKIVLPASGAVGFTAYYPYTAQLSGNELAIDTKAHPHDVLFSNNLTAVTGKADLTTKALQFKHMLSKVSFALTGAPAGVSLQSVTIKNVATRTKMNVTTGALTVATTPDQVSLKVNGTEAYAILVPATNKAVELLVTTTDGKNYKYAFSNDLALASGKSYKYQLRFATGEVVVNEVNGNISDWEEVDGGNVDITPIEEDPITPPIPDPLPTIGTPLFAGSDFEDWTLMPKDLNSFGLKPYVTQAPGAGRNNSAALHISTTATTTSGNDFLFTKVVPASGAVNLTGKKITLYVKGTGAKSLSFNVYKKDEKAIPFNLADCSTETILTPQDKNSYTGTIAATDWTKITLDLSGVSEPLATDAGKNFFAIKIGKQAVYDLYIDDIMIE